MLFEMKSRAVIVSVLIVSLLAPATLEAESTGGLRFTIMVSKFDVQTAGYQGRFDLGDSWKSIMTAALGENENFIVVGEADMRDEAMAEQGFGASGATVQGYKTPRRGNMTPAQLLVKGVITHYEQNSSGGSGGLHLKNVRIGAGKDKTIVRATVYVIDSASGMVVASNNFEGSASKRTMNLKFWKGGKAGDLGKYDADSSSKALIDAIDQTIGWMTGKLPSIPWRGEIVMVKQNMVIVNRGQREGVRPGERFIAGEATVLRDPDTGEVLDYDIDIQANLEVDRVKEKIAYCKVVHGDLTLLYEGMGIARVDT